jgi:signal-transduction protein with cAMP-binding, CBS, and nucleotidyltransferase domain
VETALMLMQDWRVFDLPVVDAGKVIGYCHYTQLSEAGKQKKAGDLMHSDAHYTVNTYQHLFEVVKFFTENKVSVVTVLNEDTTFAGIISGKDLLMAYRQSALSQPGGIITMRMAARQYSLAEISRLVEVNDVKILHLFVLALKDEEGQIEVSIKLNTPELKNIVSTLERFQYNITGIHQAAEIPDNFQSRFDYLIKYINT